MSIFSNKKDKALMKAINEHYAVISFSPNGTILTANDNFLDALGGYKLDEIKGKHHSIFCDEKYTKTEEYKKFWSDLANGKVQNAEFTRIRKDGKLIYIQASYKPLKDSSGRVFEIVKFAQDITDKKIDDLNNSGQINAINKSQAVIEFNLDGIILNANENFLKTVGYELSEIQGKHHSIFCEPEYRNSTDYKNFWKKLNSGEFDSGQYKRIGKNNKEIWIRASYNPILGLDGKPYKVVKYATDITKRKKMMIEVDNEVVQLNNSLDKLSESSLSLSNTSKSTRKESNEVSKSIEHINNSVAEVSNSIKNTLSSVTEISNSTQEGESIAKIALSKSKDTTSTILKLDDESQKIGETVNIISQIAFQTNILSLNAAVEAATAGEAGKGFAVVAGEVRNLANRSNEAAKDINEAILYIQALIKDSLESINSIDKTIEKMAEISTNISKSMDEQKNVSNDLTNITQEVSEEINHITNKMLNLSENTNLTDEESNKNLNISNELIEVSNHLIAILQKLR